MASTKSCVRLLIAEVALRLGVALEVHKQSAHPYSVALSPLPANVPADDTLNLLGSAEAAGADADLVLRLRRFTSELEKLDAEGSGHWFGGHHSTNGSARNRYMDEKLAIDASVIQSVTSRSSPATTLRGNSQHQQKVAFLFMLMTDVTLEKVWNKFFADAPQANYSIYTHAALDSQDGTHPLQQWNAKPINWVNTSWCALLGVEVALLSAALGDPANQQFVFVSQDAVPLKSFGYTYKAVMDSPKKSKFCFASAASHKHVLVEVAMNQIHGGCVYRDFYRGHDERTVKHHQWVVLSRDHAKTIIENAHLGLERWSQTWRVVAPDLKTGGEGCSDESVPATTLLLDMAARGQSTADTWADLDKLGVEQKCFTYVHWYNCWRNTEFEQKSAPFFKNIVERGGDIWNLVFDKDFDFLKQSSLNSFPMVWKELPWDLLKNLAGQGFLFMRKMDPSVHVLNNQSQPVPLETALPELWAGVDEAYAHAHVWNRLEGSGRPAE